MDAIDRAIEKGWHLSNEDDWEFQTWDMFEVDAADKKIILFGVGAGANFFCYKYGEKVELELLIDNATNLQGLKAEVVVPREAIKKDICVNDISQLSKYEKDEVVIVIGSLKYYREIYKQIREIGDYKAYAVLSMEANRRKEEIDESSMFDYYVNKACTLPICPNKIVLLTMSDYAGHGKGIVKALLSKTSGLDIVWAVKDMRIEVPKGVRLVYKKNIRELVYEIETAKIWLFDAEIHVKYRKRTGQYNIQIKHWASVTLKKFGFDMDKFHKDANFMQGCSNNREMMDYLMVGSLFDEKICRSGFCFDGEVVHVGSPRSDALFQMDECLENVKKKYEISDEIKYLVYAPTFRSVKGTEYRPEITKIDLDFAETKRVLEERFGGNWNILLRLHPGVPSRVSDLPKYVINVTDYNDGEEIIAISDMMITDYSSIMFEPAFVGKPVFLLATDKNEYIEEERDFWIDYEDLPFPIAESSEELAENIRTFNYEDYEKRLLEFLEKYGVHEDGHASERAAEFILNLLEKE